MPADRRAPRYRSSLSLSPRVLLPQARGPSPFQESSPSQSSPSLSPASEQVRQLEVLRAERAEIAQCFLMSHEEIHQLRAANAQLQKQIADQAGKENGSALEQLRSERNEAAASVLASQVEIEQLQSANAKLKRLRGKPQGNGTANYEAQIEELPADVDRLEHELQQANDHLMHENEMKENQMNGLRDELAGRQDETVRLLAENEAMRALLLEEKVEHQKENMQLCEQIAQLQNDALNNEDDCQMQDRILSMQAQIEKLQQLLEASSQNRAPAPATDTTKVKVSVDDKVRSEREFEELKAQNLFTKGLLREAQEEVEQLKLAVAKSDEPASPNDLEAVNTKLKSELAQLASRQTAHNEQLQEEIEQHKQQRREGERSFNDLLASKLALQKAKEGLEEKLVKLEQMNQELEIAAVWAPESPQLPPADASVQQNLDKEIAELQTSVEHLTELNSGLLQQIGDLKEENVELSKQRAEDAEALEAAEEKLHLATQLCGVAAVAEVDSDTQEAAATREELLDELKLRLAAESKLAEAERHAQEEAANAAKQISDLEAQIRALQGQQTSNEAAAQSPPLEEVQDTPDAQLVLPVLHDTEKELSELQGLDCTVSNENSPPLTARRQAVQQAKEKQYQAEQALIQVSEDREREEMLILDELQQIEASHEQQVETLSEEIVNIEMQKLKLVEEVGSLKAALQQVQTEAAQAAAVADAKVRAAVDRAESTQAALLNLEADRARIAEQMQEEKEIAASMVLQAEAARKEVRAAREVAKQESQQEMEQAMEAWAEANTKEVQERQAAADKEAHAAAEWAEAALKEERQRLETEQAKWQSELSSVQMKLEVATSEREDAIRQRVELEQRFAEEMAHIQIEANVQVSQAARATANSAASTETAPPPAVERGRTENRAQHGGVTKVVTRRSTSRSHSRTPSPKRLARIIEERKLMQGRASEVQTIQTRGVYNEE